jgi:hypothetical protein
MSVFFLIVSVCGFAVVIYGAMWKVPETWRIVITAVLSVVVFKAVLMLS